MERGAWKQLVTVVLSVWGFDEYEYWEILERLRNTDMVCDFVRREGGRGEN